jgi:hypothetical protein
VRVGLWREAARARRQAQAGLISAEGLVGRLAAYECVRDMTYA